MPEANAQQVQRYCDERVRVRAEQVRALVLACRDDKAAIDDIYAGLTGTQSGWVDSRDDGPPHLATASDVLAYNTFINDLITFVDGNAQYNVILDLCVRPVNGSGS